MVCLFSKMIGDSYDDSKVFFVYILFIRTKTTPYVLLFQTVIPRRNSYLIDKYVKLNTSPPI